MSLLSTEDQQVGDDGTSAGAKTYIRNHRMSDNYDSFENTNVITFSSASNGNHNCCAKKEKLTYTELLSNNSNYCYFLLSYLINHMVCVMDVAVVL